MKHALPASAFLFFIIITSTGCSTNGPECERSVNTNLQDRNLTPTPSDFISQLPPNNSRHIISLEKDINFFSADTSLMPSNTTVLAQGKENYFNGKYFINAKNSSIAALGILFNKVSGGEDTIPKKMYQGVYSFDNKKYVGMVDFMDMNENGELQFIISIGTSKGCTSSLKGSAKFDEPGIATYQDSASGCKLNFVFTENKLEIKEKKCRQFHGETCEFRGRFTKE